MTVASRPDAYLHRVPGARPKPKGKPHGKGRGASPGLLTLLQRIEAGEVELHAAPEPDPGVPGLDLFCGPGTGWSPEDESGGVRVEVFCTLEPQEVVVAYTCPKCRDGQDLPESLCCARCMRSRHDARIRAILRDHPAPGPG